MLGSEDVVWLGDLTRTELQHVDVDFGKDDQPDFIAYEGTARADVLDFTRAGDDVVGPRLHITGSEAADQLRVCGREGDDAITFGPGTNEIITPSIGD